MCGVRVAAISSSPFGPKGPAAMRWRHQVSIAPVDRDPAPDVFGALGDRQQLLAPRSLEPQRRNELEDTSVLGRDTIRNLDSGLR